ncbi:hypothetical protein C8R44DRAFT_864234 [Mycena epipterygia]|nr:hypothetical protein C8R44DRAFT_864234 [Mycena epipterygia]
MLAHTLQYGASLQAIVLTNGSHRNPERDIQVVRLTLWVLGRVCGKWRAIALDTLFLWASVTLAIPYGSSPILAKSFPLRLFPAATTKALFCVISTTSARWEALEFESRQSLIHKQLRGNLLLCRLRLCPSGLERRLFMPDTGHRRGRRWDYQLGKGLGQATGLVSCQFTAYMLYETESDSPPPLPTQFAHLRKLTLLVHSMLAIALLFLNSLNLPMLEELHIKFESAAAPGIVNLLQRTNDALTKLWVDGPLRGTDFVAIAEAHPRIAELGLFWRSTMDSVVQEMVVTPGQHPLLLDLRVLHILRTGIYMILTLDMFESRRAAGKVTLKTVSMDVPWYSAYRKRLDALKEGGLDVQMRRNEQDPMNLLHCI